MIKIKDVCVPWYGYPHSAGEIPRAVNRTSPIEGHGWIGGDEDVLLILLPLLPLPLLPLPHFLSRPCRFLKNDGNEALDLPPYTNLDEGRNRLIRPRLHQSG